MTDNEIEARLRAVELQLATLAQLLDADLKAHSETIRIHGFALFGNPEKGKAAPGLTVLVDRLEATDLWRRWGVQSLGAALFTVLGTLGTKYFWK